MFQQDFMSGLGNTIGNRMGSQRGGRVPSDEPQGKPPWPVAQRTPSSAPDEWSGARAAPSLRRSASAECVSPKHPHLDVSQASLQGQLSRTPLARLLATCVLDGARGGA